MTRMTLTDEEVVLVQRNRAREMTGFDAHRWGDGWYVWSWGKQPESPLVGKTPVDAAKRFLQVYQRRDDSMYPIARNRSLFDN